ncbi:hypothetical protein pb186bvf_017332 [Paramecium bursaria]
MAEDRPFFKIIVIGDSGVGKSSILKQYVLNQFPESIKPTLGLEFMKKIVQINDTEVELQLWDTAGEEVFRSLSKQYYRQAAAVLFIFDLTNQESMNGLIKWINDVNEIASQHIVKILVGNKSDAQRKVSKEDATQFMDSNKMAFYYETSAKTGNNVDLVFQKCVEQILLQLVTKQRFKDEVKHNQNVQNSVLDVNTHKEKSKRSCC